MDISYNSMHLIIAVISPQLRTFDFAAFYRDDYITPFINDPFRGPTL